MISSRNIRPRRTETSFWKQTTLSTARAWQQASVWADIRTAGTNGKTKADRRSTRYIGKSWNSLRPTGSLRFPSAFRRIHSYLNESAFRRSWKPSRNSSSTGATGASSSRRWWPEASCRSAPKR